MSCNTDSDGRRILLNIEHGGDNLTLVNVYAPNSQSDRKAFFTRCEKWIRRYKSQNNLFLGGDMNCCINDCDRVPVTHLKDASRGALKKLVDTLNLYDCWQKKKPMRVTSIPGIMQISLLRVEMTTCL